MEDDYSVETLRKSHSVSRGRLILLVFLFLIFLFLIFLFLIFLFLSFDFVFFDCLCFDLYFFYLLFFIFLFSILYLQYLVFGVFLAPGGKKYEFSVNQQHLLIINRSKHKLYNHPYDSILFLFVK